MVLRQCSWARFTRGNTTLPEFTLACFLYSTCLFANFDARASPEGVQLDLSPRICTMAADDKQCQAKVHTSWRSPRESSVCLIIVSRPDLKRCWENASQGDYTVDILAAEDVTFELEDIGLQRVVASEVMRVVRETVRYRHRRRQPWSLFE